MKDIIMYTSSHCPYCKQAESLFQKKGLTGVRKINIDGDDALRREMMEKTQRRTVPQIYVGDTHVGGFDDLAKLERAGELDSLLRD